MMIDIQSIKSKFPILKNYAELSYLDNAATTQKPAQVIEAEVEFYEKYNANVHRGIYDLSEKASEKYEQAREAVAKFINSKPEEIIFTGGTTDSLNSLANSLNISRKTKPGKSKQANIVISELEHHSNILPWTRIENAKIHFLKLDKNFQVILPKESQPDVDIIAITHASNVTGTVNDLNKIFNLYPNAIKVVDAAQSIAHFPIDVKKLNVDFIAFSAHKAYGPTGLGVLYGRDDLLREIPPLRVGGGMITEVTKDSAEFADIPSKHEAGTPQIAQAAAFIKALEFMQDIGMENIQKHEKEMRSYILQKFKEVPEIEIYHPAPEVPAGAVISFNIEGIHAHDAAQLLADENVAIRAGHHCAQILHRDVIKAQGSLRASFAIYNSKQDIDKLIEAIKKAIEQFT